MRDAYEALAQEPWCFTPDQIARLTDWQIFEQYLKPAARRAEEMRKDLPDPPPGAGTPGKTLPTPPRRAAAGRGPDGEPGDEVHRRQVVGAFVSVMGMSRQAAEAKYEAQLAEYHRMRAAGEL